MAKPTGHGPAPAIGGAVEAAMLGLAGKPGHLTLAEIAARLAEAHGVRAPAKSCKDLRATTAHRALRRAGWT